MREECICERQRLTLIFRVVGSAIKQIRLIKLNGNKQKLSSPDGEIRADPRPTQVWDYKVVHGEETYSYRHRLADRMQIWKCQTYLQDLSRNGAYQKRTGRAEEEISDDDARPWFCSFASVTPRVGSLAAAVAPSLVQLEPQRAASSNHFVRNTLTDSALWKQHFSRPEHHAEQSRRPACLPMVLQRYRASCWRCNWRRKSLMLSIPHEFIIEKVHL